MEKNNRAGKRLRLIPLILGGYGAFLGLGLVIIGFVQIREGIGIVRFLIGLGMTGFGLLGIWDGVRDLFRPNKKLNQAPTIQFILTDTYGNKSSLVTPELLQKQMEILAECNEYKHFDLQILPYLPAKEHNGMLKQITCVCRCDMILMAFFEMPENGYQIYQKSMNIDMAVEWLRQLLAGNPDFSEWENSKVLAQQDKEIVSQNEENAQWDEVDDRQEDVEDIVSFCHQLLTNQKGQMTYWRQFLVIFGESWHDEHKFFSARDVELAIEGIYERKYQKVFLEWGTQAFDLFPGIQNELMVIWCTNNTEKGDIRFFAREGTVTQVKFWLVNYLDHGFFEEISGWVDITAQIEKAKRKGEKKHGKVF